MVEWIVLTLCIISCFVLTGVGYMIRICRKRQSFKLRIINEDVILEPLEPSPYIGIYDEVDENPLTFDTNGLTVTSQESHYITIDPGSQEKLSLITSTEHGDTENLDLHVAMEEGKHHQLQDRSSQKECISTNSFNSDVVNPDNTAYHNLYQPLQENWQDDSHGYEVPAVVSQCFKSSLGFDENARINSDYNVYHACQKDCDMKSPAYENQMSLETHAGNDKRLLGDGSSSVFKTGNLHDYINMNVESNIPIDNCDAMNSYKPFDKDKSKTTEQKLFHCDFRAKTMNEGFNNICRSQEINNSNSNDYDDAKSCI